MSRNVNGPTISAAAVEVLRGMRMPPRNVAIVASVWLALLWVLPAAAAPTTITLLHSNDVYEIAPAKGQGGFAPFMTLLEAERARNANTITTFGGDLLSPSVMSGGLMDASDMFVRTHSAARHRAAVTRSGMPSLSRKLSMEGASGWSDEG